MLFERIQCQTCKSWKLAVRMDTGKFTCHKCRYELEKKSGMGKCGECGAFGHNRRTCEQKN